MSPSTPTAQPRPLIQIRNLEFAYEVTQDEENREGFRLQVPTLDVEEGSRVALVGRSGCGKTTLAHLIAGIVQPHGGSILVDGNEMTEKSDRERRNFRISRIGFIFQEFELLDYLKAEENILLPFLVNGSLVLDRKARERARALAASVGMEKKLRRRPGRLSQGERQRIAICRALVTNPRLIIADEPTGNLDPRTSDEVMSLLHDRVKEAGSTLLMVTHDHQLLDQFDRTIHVDGDPQSQLSGPETVKDCGTTGGGTKP